MSESSKSHIEILDKKITALSDALAHLGKGTSLRELIKIIRFPGYTTPAELGLSVAILDSMLAHTNALNKLESDLLVSSKLIIEQR